MSELTVHPNVYATGSSHGLIAVLERIWLRDHQMGDGTLYVISGFANFNGGVRFFPLFRRHVDEGGRVVAVFAGSAQSNLTSRQIVREMLNCGAEVHIVNRKRLMHAKTYGSKTRDGETVVVTSGNFTGPGMSQNVEITVLLDHEATQGLRFSWDQLFSSLMSQQWDYHRPALRNDDATDPAWRLLYDEQPSKIALDQSNEVTLILSLGHSDTARIVARPGTSQAKGTQYFWLSRDCYDFFPALTIPNSKGTKRTYSCLVSIGFVDLGCETTVRVTFEAENNLDFRLGTGPLRGSGLATKGDIAAVSRIADAEYELRIYRKGSRVHAALKFHATNFVGHRGKQYGFVANQVFERITGTQVGR